jgi:outer membrane protein OmpA-like peptidoglycan-associated protein
MKAFPAIALSVAAALTAACSSTPKTFPAVETARQRIDAVAGDPLAREAASASISAAEQDLKRAEQALQEREPRRTIEHYAYLANRNAEIAAEQIGERRARMAVEKGQADRDRVLLEARTREAERAKAEAEAARNRALAATAEAESARSSALSATAEAEKLRSELTALQAKPTERGMVLTLGDVLFDTGRSDLKAGAMATIDRLADFMRDNAGYQLLVEGHTDSRGDDAYNLQLSESRAAAVRTALVNRGLAGDRVRVKALGESYPVADNESASGRQQNRRVEIVFSDAQGQFAGAAERQVRADP